MTGLPASDNIDNATVRPAPASATTLAAQPWILVRHEEGIAVIERPATYTDAIQSVLQVLSCTNMPLGQLRVRLHIPDLFGNQCVTVQDTVWQFMIPRAAELRVDRWPNASRSKDTVAAPQTTPDNVLPDNDAENDAHPMTSPPRTPSLPTQDADEPPPVAATNVRRQNPRRQIVRRRYVAAEQPATSSEPSSSRVSSPVASSSREAPDDTAVRRPSKSKLHTELPYYHPRLDIYKFSGNTVSFKEHMQLVRSWPESHPTEPWILPPLALHGALRAYLSQPHGERDDTLLTDLQLDRNQYRWIHKRATRIKELSDRLVCSVCEDDDDSGAGTGDGGSTRARLYKDMVLAHSAKHHYGPLRTRERLLSEYAMSPGGDFLKAWLGICPGCDY